MTIADLLLTCAAFCERHAIEGYSYVTANPYEPRPTMQLRVEEFERVAQNPRSHWVNHAIHFDGESDGVDLVAVAEVPS